MRSLFVLALALSLVAYYVAIPILCALADASWRIVYNLSHRKKGRDVHLPGRR